MGGGGIDNEGNNRQDKNDNNDDDDNEDETNDHYDDMRDNKNKEKIAKEKKNKANSIAERLKKNRRKVTKIESVSTEKYFSVYNRPLKLTEIVLGNIFCSAHSSSVSTDISNVFVQGMTSCTDGSGSICQGGRNRTCNDDASTNYNRSKSNKSYNKTGDNNEDDNNEDNNNEDDSDCNSSGDDLLTTNTNTNIQTRIDESRTISNETNTNNFEEESKLEIIERIKNNGKVLHEREIRRESRDTRKKERQLIMDRKKIDLIEKRYTSVTKKRNVTDNGNERNSVISGPKQRRADREKQKLIRINKDKDRNKNKSKESKEEENLRKLESLLSGESENENKKKKKKSAPILRRGTSSSILSKKRKLESNDDKNKNQRDGINVDDIDEFENNVINGNASSSSSGYDNNKNSDVNDCNNNNSNNNNNNNGILNSRRKSKYLSLTAPVVSRRLSLRTKIGSGTNSRIDSVPGTNCRIDSRAGTNLRSISVSGTVRESIGVRTRTVTDTIVRAAVCPVDQSVVVSQVGDMGNRSTTRIVHTDNNAGNGINNVHENSTFENTEMNAIRVMPLPSSRALDDLLQLLAENDGNEGESVSDHHGNGEIKGTYKGAKDNNSSDSDNSDNEESDDNTNSEIEKRAEDVEEEEEEEEEDEDIFKLVEEMEKNSAELLIEKVSTRSQKRKIIEENDEDSPCIGNNKSNKTNEKMHSHDKRIESRKSLADDFESFLSA